MFNRSLIDSKRSSIDSNRITFSGESIEENSKYRSTYSWLTQSEQTKWVLKVLYLCQVRKTEDGSISEFLTSSTHELVMVRTTPKRLQLWNHWKPFIPWNFGYSVPDTLNNFKLFVKLSLLIIDVYLYRLYKKNFVDVCTYECRTSFERWVSNCR